MKIHALILAAVVAVVLPASAFAYTGALKFKGGCAVAATGTCKLGVTGLTGSVKIYASSSANGNYSAVSNAFTAPANKNIANSTSNVCFQARKTTGSVRTRTICLN